MGRQRSEAQKATHAASERTTYARLKAGLVAAISLRLGLARPQCTMPRAWGFPEGDGAAVPIPCGNAGAMEIDHRHFSRFRQRRMNSVQRLKMFAAEFILWMGGDESRELRLACRSCNARHQPPKILKK